MKFQENEERLKRTWTHHLPVQAGNVSLLDENNKYNKKSCSLLAANNEVSLEVTKRKQSMCSYLFNGM